MQLDEFQKEVIERLTRVETTLANHLKHQETKFNRTTAAIGIIIAGIALFVAFRPMP